MEETTWDFDFDSAIPGEAESDTTVIDWEEATILNDNARTIKEFERFYSRRYAFNAIIFNCTSNCL